MENQPKKKGRHKKLDSAKKKPHQVYATDAEWNEIAKRAELAGLDASPYVIKKSLE